MLPRNHRWPTLPAPNEGLLLAGILGLVVLVYLPTLAFGWVYDDAWTILANGFLRSDDLHLLASEASRRAHVPDAFRPTLVFVDRWTYRHLGLDPRQHHALSIALHLTACWLAHRLLMKWGAPRNVRLGAVALFGLLALHAEPIAVVSFREDLLAAVLALSALLVADISARSMSRAWWLGMPVAAALAAAAAGAKLSAAPIPIVLWLAHMIDPWEAEAHDELRRGRTATAVAALGLGIGLALVQRFVVLGGFSPYHPTAGTGAASHVLADQVGLGPVLAASVKIHVEYLAQMVVPFGLSPEYTETPGTFDEPAVWLCAAGLLATVLYAVWGSFGRRRPVAAFTILATAVLMIPTSNLVGLSNLRADRFVYLSSLPVCVGLAAAALTLGRWIEPWLVEREEGRTRIDPLLAFAPVLVLAVIQGSAAMTASRSYASNATLWKVASIRAPGSARAQAMQGLMQLSQRPDAAFVDQAWLARASGHCANAMRLDPGHELPWICQARIAVERKRWRAAYEAYGEALARSPGQHDRLLAGLIDLSVDAASEVAEADAEGASALEIAAPHILAGLREYPYSPLVAASAGRAFHRLGYPHAARWSYDRARRLYPENWQTAAWEAELALDRGERIPADALRVPHRHPFEGQFRNVDPVLRDALEARRATLRRRFLPPFLQALVDLLVQSPATADSAGAERR